MNGCYSYPELTEFLLGQEFWVKTVSRRNLKGKGMVSMIEGTNRNDNLHVFYTD